jgi:hypothetical protein
LAAIFNQHYLAHLIKWHADHLELKTLRKVKRLVVNKLTLSLRVMGPWLAMLAHYNQSVPRRLLIWRIGALELLELSANI